MAVFQALCAAVIALTAARQHRRGRGGAFLALALAALVGELIALYAFQIHRYTEGWWRLGPVPILAPLIWATLVTTAADLTRGHPLKTAGVICADLALLGPVGVQSGLWVWGRPGLFDFPLEASAAWAAFGGAWLAASRWGERRGWARWEALAVACPVALAGAFSVGGGLGLILPLIQRPLIVPHPVAVAVTFALSLAVSWRVINRGVGGRGAALARLPAMALIAALLLAYCADVPPLVICALACLPPYLALWLRPQGEVR